MTEEPVPNSSFKLLIVDKSLGNRFSVKEVIEKYFGRKAPPTRIETYQAENPNAGLELLAQHRCDVAVFNANFNSVDESDTLGIIDFLIPAKQRYPTLPTICYAYPIYREVALSSGADAFVPNLDSSSIHSVIEDHEFEKLPEIVEKLLKERDPKVQ